MRERTGLRWPRCSIALKPIRMDYQRPQTAARLCGTDAARRFFADCFGNVDSRHETLLVAHVDADTNCLHLARYDGCAGTVDLPVRAIIADALVHGSHGLVLAHSHPSGDPAPSSDDCRATRRLATAAEAIDVAVVDHLVFGGGQCSSFRRMGLL